MVSTADVTAGADMTYGIQGSSRHAHSVTVTAADFARLASGNAVSVESISDSGHSHAVMITCG